nr:HNH endonuclease family protein [Shewanella dokdonensis]
MTFAVNAEVVKMSNSGICHNSGSQYYSRVKNYTSYKDLDSCLADGGRLPKNYKGIAVTTSVSSDQEYSRDKFGSGWSDTDHDGQDTRQEVLISQNTGQILLSPSGKVKQGRWISMYSGQVIMSASEIDIDHVVPLSWAWKHGASEWSNTRRESFANDERNLLAVEASLNRQKGDKGLDEWVPPANKCQYIARFVRVLKLYQLNLTPSEKPVYTRLVEQCQKE